MRILIIHNKYIQKGGEDTTVQNESELLSTNNNDVQVLYFDNNSSKHKLFLKFISYPLNLYSYFKVRSCIKKWKPDIIHVHNFFYTASPLVFWAVKQSKLPLIVTVQNFRLLCPSSTLFHNGKLYTDEIKKNFSWKACFDKVYHDSFFLTFWLQFSNYIHSKLNTWSLPDKYIFASNFSKQVFENSKFEIYKDKFALKYNFMFNGNSNSITDRSDYFLFVGRLTEEKGVNVLAESIKKYNYKLIIIGDGPLQEDIVELSKTHSSITYLGFKNKDEILRYMSDARALIFPSIWFEGMPLTILESFSKGTPVIASNLGAMSEMIIDDVNGKQFCPGDTDDLIKQIKYFESLTEEKRYLFSKSTFEDYNKRFSSTSAYKSLINIYNSVIPNHVSK